MPAVGVYVHFVVDLSCGGGPIAPPRLARHRLPLMGSLVGRLGGDRVVTLSWLYGGQSRCRLHIAVVPTATILLPDTEPVETRKEIKVISNLLIIILLTTINLFMKQVSQQFTSI